VTEKITLESGIIEKLKPNDVFVANRGFTMKDDFAMAGAKFTIPSFTKGKIQLSVKDVEESRMLAIARIHAEHVINRCRDYRILKGPIPISIEKEKYDVILSTMYNVVAVCGALTNLSPPILT